MSSMRKKLTLLLRSERAKALAEDAPIALLALVSGSLIGAAVGAPAFASAGLGMVLSGLATNIASTFLYEAVRPDTDDEQRRKAIRDGIQARDPHIIALVTDTMTAFGKLLAEALAEAQQPQLLPALTKGMQQAGGTLAEVSPHLSAALTNSQTDWNELQRQVQLHITSIEILAETSDDAQVRNQKQVVENRAESIRLQMKATGRSRQEGNEQRVIGPGTQSVSGTTGDQSSDATDLQQVRQMLAVTIARMKVRELQKAQYGIDVPPHVVTELAELQAEVVRLRALLGV